LVVVACNTAAAYSIRRWQLLYPEKKALSVTIPGVEEMVQSNYRHFSVFATEATTSSGIYPFLYHRFGGNGSVRVVAVQDWVTSIES